MARPRCLSRLWVNVDHSASSVSAPWSQAMYAPMPSSPGTLLASSGAVSPTTKYGFTYDKIRALMAAPVVVVAGQKHLVLCRPSMQQQSPGTAGGRRSSYPTVEDERSRDRGSWSYQRGSRSSGSDFRTSLRQGLAPTEDQPRPKRRCIMTPIQPREQRYDDYA